MKLKHAFALLKLNRTFALPGIFCVVLALASSPAGADEIPGAFVYTLETDKSVYQLGESVEIMYRLDNQSLATFGIHANGDPAWDVWVYPNPDNLSFSELYDTQDRVWEAVTMWADVIWTWTFEPGDVFEQPLSWNMTDNAGLALSAGEYEVFGLVSGGISSVPYGAEIDGTSFHKQITIVPEPITAILLCAAVPLLCRSYGDRYLNRPTSVILGGE